MLQVKTFLPVLDHNWRPARPQVLPTSHVTRVWLCAMLTARCYSFDESKSSLGEHKDGLLVGGVLLRTVRGTASRDSAIQRMKATEMSPSTSSKALLATRH